MDPTEGRELELSDFPNPHATDMLGIHAKCVEYSMAARENSQLYKEVFAVLP